MLVLVAGGNAEVHSNSAFFYQVASPVNTVRRSEGLNHLLTEQPRRRHVSLQFFPLHDCAPLVCGCPSLCRSVPRGSSGMLVCMQGESARAGAGLRPDFELVIRNPTRDSRMVIEGKFDDVLRACGAGDHLSDVYKSTSRDGRLPMAVNQVHFDT